MVDIFFQFNLRHPIIYCDDIPPPPQKKNTFQFVHYLWYLGLQFPHVLFLTVLKGLKKGCNLLNQEFLICKIFDTFSPSHSDSLSGVIPISFSSLVFL